MAFGLRRELEARTLLIPALDEVKDDFHSIKKIVTSANNVRLEADKSDSEVSGHADRFWGWALANHAAKSYTGETFVATRGRRKIHKLLEGYE
jgi:phage FluMu gp28-like protein